MAIRQPTSEEVGKLSEATGEGRMQCKKWLSEHFRREAVMRARTVEDLRAILLTLCPDPCPPNVKEIIQ